MRFYVAGRMFSNINLRECSKVNVITFQGEYKSRDTVLMSMYISDESGGLCESGTTLPRNSSIFRGSFDPGVLQVNPPANTMGLRRGTHHMPATRFFCARFYSWLGCLSDSPVRPCLALRPCLEARERGWGAGVTFFFYRWKPPGEVFVCVLCSYLFFRSPLFGT